MKQKRKNDHIKRKNDNRPKYAPSVPQVNWESLPKEFDEVQRDIYKSHLTSIEDRLACNRYDPEHWRNNPDQQILMYVVIAIIIAMLMYAGLAG